MKKLLSRILVFVMLVPTMQVFAEQTSYGNSFVDVPQTHWAYRYIEEMARQGILLGYGDGNFGPEDTITRAELATMLCRVGGIKTDENISASYADVADSDWFAPYVESGKSYINFYTIDGREYYKPNDNAIREDISVALVKLKGYDTSTCSEEELNAKFNDVNSISIGGRKYVYAAVANGLISGYDDGSFRGQDSVTRAEAATLFYKTYQYGNGTNKVFDTDVNDSLAENRIGFLDGSDVIIANNDIIDAKASYSDEQGAHIILTLSDEGRIKFADATEEISKRTDGRNCITICVNDTIISAPSVWDKIDSDTVIIVGDFTQAEAEELAKNIRLGINE